LRKPADHGTIIYSSEDKRPLRQTAANEGGILMKKRSVAIFLILALLLSGITAASAAPPIPNLQATPFDTTSVGVSWGAVAGDPLYTVTCQTEGSDYSTERRTYQLYCTINNLSPGTTYVITVSTRRGYTSSTTVMMPLPQDYIGFGYQLLGVGLYKSTKYETDYSAFTALTGTGLYDTLAETEYHFMFNFRMSATNTQKYLDFELVLTMPNGDAYTVSNVLEYTGSDTTITEYVPFNSALRKLYNDYGTYPAGVYKLTAYIGNDFAAETTFTME
jgi:hypothetical protein